MSAIESVIVVGTGALGALFAARFSTRVSVTMLGGWREQIETIQRDGLIVETAHGTEEHTHPRAITDVRDATPADLALFLVKGTQTARSAALLPRVLTPTGIALTLQNGLGNLEQIAAVVGPNRAALGVTTQGATTVAPGRVREGGRGTTTLGWQNGLLQDLEEIADLFERAGFATHVSNDVAGLMWGKLLVNCAINPVTALLGLPNGALLTNPDALALAEGAAREVAAVAAARGVQLPFNDPAARVREVAHVTAANHSSMLQDITRGVATEIEAINGALIREGERVGVPTPINQTLYHLVRALDRRR